jgi:hypothetical protein
MKVNITETSGNETVQSRRLARTPEFGLKSKFECPTGFKKPTHSQPKSIEDLLDIALPRAYTSEIYHAKRTSLFEHFYESYPERDASF